MNLSEKKKKISVIDSIQALNQANEKKLSYAEVI